jgi:hypothetical protein
VQASAVLLALAANVVLELSDQGKNSHAGAGGGVDARIIDHLKGNPSFSEVGNDAIEIGR